MVHTLLIGGMRILERILTVAFVVVESKAATIVDILILKISLHVSYAVFAIKNLMMLLLWTVKIISDFKVNVRPTQRILRSAGFMTQTCLGHRRSVVHVTARDMPCVCKVVDLY